MRTELTQAEFTTVKHARVARLATVSPSGHVHVVPVCPVLDGDHLLVALEAGSAKERNLLADGRVALVVDDYVEDWNGLRGVVIRGSASVLPTGEEWTRARDLLYAKFPQYPHLAPVGPADRIARIAIEHVASWGYEG